MEKLNELVEQAKFVADWHGSDWSSALCQGKDGKQTHEIICESRGEAVISTGSNSNEASWLCDYLELCSPANILDIAEAFRALQKQRDALAAENAALRSNLMFWDAEDPEMPYDLPEEIANNCCMDFNTEFDVQVAAKMPNRTYRVSEVGDYDCTVELVSGGMPETPATDAYLNSVRAEGVDYVAEAIGAKCAELKLGSKDWKALKSIVFTLGDFAAKIRAGKDGE